MLSPTNPHKLSDWLDSPTGYSGRQNLLIVSDTSGKIVSIFTCHGCSVIHAAESSTNQYDLSGGKQACQDYMTSMAKRSRGQGYNINWLTAHVSGTNGLRKVAYALRDKWGIRRPKTFDKYHQGDDAPFGSKVPAANSSLKKENSMEDDDDEWDQMASMLCIEDEDGSVGTPRKHAIPEEKSKPAVDDRPPHRQYRATNVNDYISDLESGA